MNDMNDNEDTVIKHEVVRREGAFGITPFIIETGKLGIYMYMYMYYMLMLLLIAVCLYYWLQFPTFSSRLLIVISLSLYLRSVVAKSNATHKPYSVSY